MNNRQPANMTFVAGSRRLGARHKQRSMGRTPFWIAFCCLCLPVMAPGLPVMALGQEQKQAPSKPELPFVPGPNWTRLARDYEVWIDLKAKQVLVGGRICLRQGMLEMFACPKNTKEHEAIIAVNTPSRFVHAGLVALGAHPGPPVRFHPDYKPAEGTEILITVVWKDAAGKEHRVRAQEWVRHMKTGKQLQYPWVFAGSGFWTDQEAGERFYYADGGEFICVSNFPEAMLDLPVESSDANDTLLFGAFTERIPPLETRVFLILVPQLKSETPKTEAAADQKPAGDTAADEAKTDEAKTDEAKTDEAKTTGKDADPPAKKTKEEPGKEADGETPPDGA